jgi:membrane protease YdiL (CAAX protease family)
MMTAMPNAPGRGRIPGMLGAGWLMLALGAWIYARMRSFPGWAALPVAAAFLIEIPFYLSPGFKAARDWFGRQGKARAACLLTASAVAPWVVYSVATGEARFTSFVLLLLVAAVVSYWYIALPAAPVADALFIVTVAAVYLSKIFDRIYLSPIPKLPISVLGHLMLIRTAALAILVFRGNVMAEYRLIPNRREWVTGLAYFAVMLPIIGSAYWGLGLVQLRPHPHGIGLTVLQGIGTFALVLWVLALSEEFFFRGLLQQWLEQWTGNANIALIVAALVFGCAHLGFHRIFPNWRWAIVAAILGIFCGLAWRNSRSVQAAMVTHALIVTVWQMMLQLK